MPGLFDLVPDHSAELFSKWVNAGAMCGRRVRGNRLIRDPVS